VNQQGFQGITNAGFLDLGIEADARGHLEVCTFIHKDMADSFIMLDYGYFRMTHDKPDQFFSSPGDDEINLILQLEHLLHGFSFFKRKNLNGLSGKPLVDKGVPEKVSNDPV
jgi:hypothetical protein